MDVGFIGLGTMGGSMAMNAIRGGHRLVVHDIRRESATPHLEMGAEWADTPREVAQRSEVVLTSLPGPVEVEAVALGEDGLAEGLTEGKVYLDLSTSSPDLIRRIHAELTPRGIHVLDAPVSGGPDGARAGRLAIWVGGDREVYERVKPVLDSIGDQPYYVGPVGAGSVTKLVHNGMVYIIQTALAEVFTMGVKAGMDPLDLWLAVRQGALGRRGVFERLKEHFLIDSYDTPDFPLRLGRKDLDLACQLGRQYDVPMKLANLSLADMTEALNRGWAERDTRVSMTLQEERAGVKVNTTAEAIREALGE